MPKKSWVVAPRVLKAKVQCDFSSAYSPDQTRVLRLIKINLNIDITQPGTKSWSCTIFFLSVCFLFIIFKPNFPADSPSSNFHFFTCYGGHSATCRSLEVRTSWRTILYLLRDPTWRTTTTCSQQSHTKTADQHLPPLEEKEKRNTNKKANKQTQKRSWVILSQLTSLQKNFTLQLNSTECSQSVS